MSWMSVLSYWRCQNCQTENQYDLTWQHFYEFKEIPNEMYSIEKCKCCGKEYYVSETEPNPLCFKMNRGPCKNDYVKDLVMDIEEANNKFTIIGQCWTT